MVKEPNELQKSQNKVAGKGLIQRHTPNAFTEHNEIASSTTVRGTKQPIRPCLASRLAAEQTER